MKRSLISTGLAALFGTLFEPEAPEVKAGLKEVEPPEFLYIRVNANKVKSFQDKGMPSAVGRYWLWNTRPEAARYTDHATVLTIYTHNMHLAGHTFWLASDGSYTVREIPAQFIQ